MSGATVVHPLVCVGALITLQTMIGRRLLTLAVSAGGEQHDSASDRSVREAWQVHIRLSAAAQEHAHHGHLHQQRQHRG